MPYTPEQTPPVSTAEELARYVLRELERISQTSEEGGVGVTFATLADMIAATNTTRTVNPARFLDGLQNTPWTGLGAGATARTLPARADDVLNINDFGAIGDGNEANATINSNALDNAKARALARPFGGELYVPGGNYVLAREFIIPNSGSQFAKLTMRGAGQFLSTLKARSTSSGPFASGAALLRIQGQTHVEGLRIHGNSIGGVSGLTGIQIEGDQLAQPITIEKVNVILCDSYGVRIQGAQTFMSHSSVGSCRRGIYVRGPGDGHVFDTVMVLNLTHPNPANTIEGAAWCWELGDIADGMEDVTLRNCIALPNTLFIGGTLSGLNGGVLVRNGNLFNIDGCMLEGRGPTTGTSVWISGLNPSSVRVTNCWLGSGLRVNGGINGLNVAGCVFPNRAPLFVLATGPYAGGDFSANAGRNFINIVNNFFRKDTLPYVGHQVFINNLTMPCFVMGNHCEGRVTLSTVGNTVGSGLCGILWIKNNGFHRSGSNDDPTTTVWDANYGEIMAAAGVPS